MLRALNKASFVISNSNFTKTLAIKNGLNEKKLRLFILVATIQLKQITKVLRKQKIYTGTVFQKLLLLLD